MKKIAAFLSILACFYAVESFGVQPLSIKWDDLIPAQSKATDPLADLAEEERGAIEWIIYLRENIEQITADDQEQLISEVDTALPKLKEQGYDIDQIIADRRRQDTSINTSLDGKSFKIAGYLLPLDLSGKHVREFLLVPVVGACVHVPPPPPNQIIHAQFENGGSYEMDDLYEPVYVTGNLAAKALSKDLFLGDGSSNVDIGYMMRIDKIEKFKPEE